MSEIDIGTTDSRGEWHPAERPGPAPLWAWPPRPLAALKWIFGFPGYLFPWNAIIGLTAIATWFYAQPELSRMAEFRVDWIAQIYVRNLALLVLFAGGMHLWLYTIKGQGTRHKFSPKWLGGKSPTFLGGTQVRDNIFWSVASGCTVWTVYEALMMWAYANGTLATVDWSADPVYFAGLLGLLMMWHVTHFYFGHRLLHWKPLYRSAHYLHHKNVNIGPWSGLSMHPIEHIIYFSTILIFLVVPSHPIHAMFALQFAALTPAGGHLGFDKLVVWGKFTLPSDYPTTCTTGTSTATMGLLTRCRSTTGSVPSTTAPRKPTRACRSDGARSGSRRAAFGSCLTGQRRAHFHYHEARRAGAKAVEGPNV
jgi:sterol desaturase/sphingolipid hydroxylase (fatty acid hydroxylase superfamily)